MKLYDIANEYRVIDALLEANGGELTPEVEQALEGLDGELDGKVDAICVVIRERDAELDGLHLEINRLKERANAVENGTDHLRLYLREQLERAGKPKVKTVRNTVWAATASRPSIRWTGEGEPPHGYTKPKVELDGAFCQQYIKNGGTLPDGFRVEWTKYLGMR